MNRNMEDINQFAVFPTGYFGLVTPQNSLELYEGNIRLTGRDGQELVKFAPRIISTKSPNTWKTGLTLSSPITNHWVILAVSIE